MSIEIVLGITLLAGLGILFWHWKIDDNNAKREKIAEKERAVVRQQLKSSGAKKPYYGHISDNFGSGNNLPRDTNDLMAQITALSIMDEDSSYNKSHSHSYSHDTHVHTPSHSSSHSDSHSYSSSDNTSTGGND